MHGTLIFDGQCGFCTRSVDLLRRLDRRGRVRLRPYQGPGVLAEAGVSLAQAQAAVWWLGADGGRARAAEAACSAVAAALGTRLPLVAYRATRPLQERAYAWVAANRYRLPGTTPHCTRQPQDCAHP